MTAVKSLFILVLFVAAVAAAIWFSPARARFGQPTADGPASTQPTASAVSPVASTPPAANDLMPSRGRLAVPVAGRAEARVTAPTPARRQPDMALTPALRDRVKPLLNEGTDLKLAVQGFHTRQQFVATAHAARNTGVLFVVLKDRELRKHETLAQAIRELDPKVNARVEANRAEKEARADLAAAASD
jgi:hypothetical protein